MDLMAAISFLQVIRRSLRILLKSYITLRTVKLNVKQILGSCYKSCKFSRHNVAVAVHLKIFETYTSNVKRSSTKDFVDNVVNISRNPTADQKKSKPTQKRKGKANKNSGRVMNMLIRATFMVVQSNSLNSQIYHQIATLPSSSNLFTAISIHVIAEVENFTMKVTLAHQEI